MGDQQVRAVEHAVQTTYAWLRDLAHELGDEENEVAYSVLSVVLQTLRDHLPDQEVAHLGSQLPTLIRGVYYQAWEPGQQLRHERRREQFLYHVGTRMNDRALRHSPEEAVQAVFRLLDNHVSSGEIDDVLSVLPSDLRDLWPEQQGKAA